MMIIVLLMMSFAEPLAKSSTVHNVSKSMQRSIKRKHNKKVSFNNMIAERAVDKYGHMSDKITTINDKIT